MTTIHLSATEKGFLWTNYMVDSMAMCCIEYFIEKCEDPEIQEVLHFALELSTLHIKLISKMFIKENHPVPIGFTKGDVNLSAPRLFSDEFVLFYTHQLANLGLSFYSKALSMVARKDVHGFYKECISSSTELNTKTKELLLKKGLYVRPPYIADPSQAEMISKKSYLKGFIGEKRPLTSLEISNLFFNIQNIEVTKTLLIGFVQVADTKDVKDFLARGKEISTKTLKELQSFLEADDLSSATPWYTYVSDSTVSPFSDKLIMFHASILSGGGIEQYGFSLATIMRRDVGAKYAKLLSEMMTVADDGMNLMIKHNWMEQPPMATEHK
ncbi:hypothetical protein JOC75_000762 [Metabacillus crassostreae]|uniref:DUF3231 family protein n=1 Tax=Metabacillus crassostreae TaxID=929098 RepID=UPI001959A192|nr:DUF3231 family protein [Metabacillus crassostreae]MBM7602792.1 hypothetical protein [Metabacillus crassostreae]